MVTSVPVPKLTKTNQNDS